jgi:hypothetical protein
VDIEVLFVNKKFRLFGSGFTVSRYKVGVAAKVLKVHRSATGLKPGAKILIRYDAHSYNCLAGNGPSSFPTLATETVYRAHLTAGESRGVYTPCGAPSNAFENRSGKPAEPASPEGNQKEGSPAWPRDLSKHLGKTITLEGTAANAKFGALLKGDGGEIWIDGLEKWAEGICAAEGKGKRLWVRGTVIQRDDLPASVEKPGEPAKAGIPVRSEKEQEQAKRRYLLKDAKWTVLD